MATNTRPTYQPLGRSAAQRRINALGGEDRSFFFLLDFELNKFLVFPEEEIPDDMRFSIDEDHSPPRFSKALRWKPRPISYARYKKAFNRIQEEIKYGNTYLINLCFPSPVDTNLSLREIYRYSSARFKLYLPGHFVVFSPEPFIRIRDGKVFTFPMKGTMDASLPHAGERLLNDQKELSEHYTVVDLLRNDIGSISEQVELTRFRYIEEVQTHRGPILQMSSELCGVLPVDYRSYLGDLLFRMLPAGSVSGAPKSKTLEIIGETEDEPRGYYCGVFGRYASGRLDSAVCIRYLEQRNNGLVYKSGGGITYRSDSRSEYEEMINKVYVPLQTE